MIHLSSYTNLLVADALFLWAADAPVCRLYTYLTTKILSFS
jgi:hypothetical protein